MKPVDQERAYVFRDRGKSFFDAMKLAADDVPAYGPAVALLAVHCAISFADAIMVHHAGRRSDGDHGAAAKQLRRLAKGKKVKDLKAVTEFTRLLGKKNEYAYTHKVLKDTDVMNAYGRAISFMAWASEHFSEIIVPEEE